MIISQCCSQSKSQSKSNPRFLLPKDKKKIKVSTEIPLLLYLTSLSLNPLRQDAETPRKIQNKDKNKVQSGWDII
jgi:hypothetical protein